MTKPLTSLQDVLANRLCTGCGACAAIAPREIEMKETIDENRRPRLKTALSGKMERRVLDACPSAMGQKQSSPKSIAESAWGPVLEVWEGYAVDHAIRHKGSSGGAVTALALYTIEQEKFHGALHVKARKDNPALNEAAISKNRDELMQGAGSRYAPASIGDKLSLVAEAPNQCAIIGKPCDIAGALKTADFIPALKEKIGLTISIFCAGTPSHEGTKALLDRLSPKDPATLTKLDYRGEGWPGDMRAKWSLEGRTETKSISYSEGWGKILQQHRQWRCHTCADHTGEYADISVGDPWHIPSGGNKPGKSLIVIRSERGRQLLQKIKDSGYLFLEKKDPEVLFKAQPNLFATKGAVWGRSLALKASGLRAPDQTASSFHCWLALPIKAKIQSVFGTGKRIFKKKLYLSNNTKWLPSGYFSR